MHAPARRNRTLLLAVATALHVAWVLVAPRPAISSDADSYHQLATHLAEGGGYVADGHVITNYVPGYPIFLAGIYAVFGHNPLVGYLANALLVVGAALAVALLAERAFGRGRGWMAGALIAGYPALFMYSATMNAECLVVALSALFFAATGLAVSSAGQLLVRPEPPNAVRKRRARTQTRKTALLGVAAFALGGLALTKPELLLWAPVVPLAAFTSLRGTTRELPRYRAVLARIFLNRPLLIGTVAVTLALAAAVLPWQARNSALVGRRVGVSSSSGYALWLTAHDPQLLDTQSDDFHAAWDRCEHEDGPTKTQAKADDFAIDACLRKEAVAMVRTHPGHYAKVVVKNVPRLLLGSQTEVFPPLAEAFGTYKARGQYGALAAKGLLFLLPIALYVLAAVGIFRQRKHPLTIPFVYAIVVKIGIHAVVFSTARYSLHLLPLFAFFAAGALREPAREERKD
jgi:4-amino-4-deoxy-L-arabinose transferase-like glycosyltransferase